MSTQRGRHRTRQSPRSVQRAPASRPVYNHTAPPPPLPRLPPAPPTYARVLEQGCLVPLHVHPQHRQRRMARAVKRPVRRRRHLLGAVPPQEEPPKTERHLLQPPRRRARDRVDQILARVGARPRQRPLAPRQDDGLAEAGEAQAQRGGGKGHRVRAVDNHKRVIVGARAVEQPREEHPLLGAEAAAVRVEGDAHVNVGNGGNLGRVRGQLREEVAGREQRRVGTARALAQGAVVGVAVDGFVAGLLVHPKRAARVHEEHPWEGGGGVHRRGWLLCGGGRGGRRRRPARRRGRCRRRRRRTIGRVDGGGRPGGGARRKHRGQGDGPGGRLAPSGPPLGRRPRRVGRARGDPIGARRRRARSRPVGRRHGRRVANVSVARRRHGRRVADVAVARRRRLFGRRRPPLAAGGRPRRPRRAGRRCHSHGGRGGGRGGQPSRPAARGGAPDGRRGGARARPVAAAAAAGGRQRRGRHKGRRHGADRRSASVARERGRRKRKRKIKRRGGGGG